MVPEDMGMHGLWGRHKQPSLRAQHAARGGWEQGSSDK